MFPTHTDHKPLTATWTTSIERDPISGTHRRRLTLRWKPATRSPALPESDAGRVAHGRPAAICQPTDRRAA
jgi:hypothetical protein